MFSIYANGKLLYWPMDKVHTLLSPKLVLEWGKAGALQFKIPKTNPRYESMVRFRTRVTVEMDGEEIFRGRVLTNSRGFNNTKTIRCEGDLAYLVDSAQPETKFSGKAHDLFRRTIDAHNARTDEYKRFAVGVITADNPDIIVVGKTDGEQEAASGDYKQIAVDSMTNKWPTSFDTLEKYLIDEVGGYLRTRKEGDTIYIDWLKESGGTTGQAIRFGKNLLDLTDESADVDDAFSVLIPLGDDNLTIAAVNGGSDELVDEEAMALYGGRIVKTQVFDGVTEPETLLENGRRYMELHAKSPATITVKAVDLHLVNPDIGAIHIGDKVRILSRPHDIACEMTCTRIEYDFENPANDVYTFGTPKQSLTERYRKDKKQTSSDITKSGRSGGGGAGTAAAEEAQKELDKFYDAWINIDKTGAHVDLGTLYKELQNEKAVLEQTCGINIDAPTGNINIRNLRTEFDELGNTVKEQGATISLLNDETKAQIELITSSHQELAEKEEGHYAEFTLYATETESAIQGKADKIELEALQTSVTALSNDMKTGLESKVSTTAFSDALESYLTKTAASEIYATVDAMTSGLKTKVETSVMGDYLTKKAASELFVTEEDVDARIGVYAVTANGTTKTFAQILADLTKVTGRLEIGDTTIVKGGLYASGGIGAAGQMTASGGLQVIGTFMLGSESVTKENLTIVTDFTQASTPGWTATPVSKTLLATSAGDVVNHNVASGDAILFN